jgi:hypothetical protein
MKRRLFNILSALSLLVCMAVVVMWVRGYFREDVYAWYSDRAAQKYWHVSSGHGGVGLLRSEGADRDMLQGFRSNEIGWSHNGVLGVLLHRDFRRIGQWWFAGFGTYHKARSGSSAEVQFWSVPYWFLFVLTAVAPALAVVRRRRRRQRQVSGLCSSCGYDLRATPDRCPECGEAIVQQVAG